jgi:hypothetical protein
MVSSGMLRRVALVRTDVSEEPSASIIRVTRIGELGTTLAVTMTAASVDFWYPSLFYRTLSDENDKSKFHCNLIDLQISLQF